MVAENPGSVLVLPWNRYLDVDNANGHLSFNPMEDFFPGDVIISADLGLANERNERVDPRGDALDQLNDDLRRGEDRASDLAQLGIRWVVILHEARYLPYLTMLDDPGISSRLVSPSIDLLSVDAWRGPAVNDRGEPVSVTGWGPIRTINGDTSVVWNEPYARGWMRGTTPTRKTKAGLISIPQGSGPVWFRPSALVLLAYTIWASATARAIYLTQRGGRSRP